MTASPLVDAATLAAHLHDPGWVSVDCRFNLKKPEAGRAAYLEGHIPGARYAHLDRDLAAPPTPSDGRHPLPDPATFAETLAAWGISNATTVVAYDDASGAIAARLWWMLRWLGHAQVHVLDGGLQTWRVKGFPINSDVLDWERAPYRVRGVNTEWVVTAAQLPDLLSRGALLLDARAAERFSGLVEPIDPVAGHVPGGSNFPFSRSLARDGTFNAPDDLRADLEPLMGRRDALEVIAMCGSGVTACHLLLGMQVAGLGQGRLYVGSWSEWIRDPERPIATGEGNPAS